MELCRKLANVIDVDDAGGGGGARGGARRRVEAEGVCQRMVLLLQPFDLMTHLRNKTSHNHSRGHLYKHYPQSSHTWFISVWKLWLAFCSFSTSAAAASTWRGRRGGRDASILTQYCFQFTLLPDFQCKADKFYLHACSCAIYYHVVLERSMYMH